MKTKNPHLRLTWITHARWAKELFDDVNLTVVTGQVIWLIWPNGAGKSTLLGIMSGAVDPWAWRVETRWDLAVVAQWLWGGDGEDGISVFSYITTDRPELEEREVMIALGRTGWDEIDIHQDVQTLSWWQQTKVRIAKCLVDEVDILLLDEPTNHLDRQWIKALQWLIKRFHGPVVIVSHDRQFLDDVVTDIFDLRWGKGEAYVGTYTSYMKERELRAEKQMQVWKDQEEKRVKMEKWLADLRQRASFYDSPRWGKLLRSRQKMFEREFVDGKQSRLDHEKKMAMAVTWWTHSYKKICTLRSGVVGREGVTWTSLFVEDETELYGGSELYMVLESLELHGKDRVVVVGNNWSGKSTLIQVLKAHLPSEEYPQWSHALITWGKSQKWLRIGRFAQQDGSLVVDERVMKRCLHTFPDGWDESMIRSKLAWAGIPEEDLVKKMSQLSYGQRVKIRFLQLMLCAYDLLILDEPTNHLDIATRESLEHMLQQYEWCLLVVSHDRRFVEEIGIQKQWKIEEGEMTESLWESLRAPEEEEFVSSWVKKEEDEKNAEVDPYDFMR